MRDMRVWLIWSVFFSGCGIAGPDESLGARQLSIENPEGNGGPDTQGVGQVVMGGALCTGTLVGPHTVLTAAHCVCGRDPTPGDRFIPGLAQQSIHVLRSVVAGCLNNIPDDVHNDLAVLTLASDVPDLAGVTKVYLDSQSFLETSQATVVGNGFLRSFGTVHPTGGDGIWSEARLPGSVLLEGGDSGGPLLMTDPRIGKPVIVGVSSSGVVDGDSPVQFWASTRGNEDFLSDNIDLSAHSVDYALYATNFLKINDRVDIQPFSNERRTVAVGAEGNLEIGADATIFGNATSLNNIVVRDRGFVVGSATARLDVALGAGAIVNAPRPRSFVRRVPPHVSEPVPEVFTSSDNVSLEPSQTRVLAPGLYGDIRVASRAKLTMKVGIYFVRSISVEPQGQLIIERTEPALPSLIHTLRFNWHGILNADPAEFLFLVWSPDTTSLETSFSGTLFAMNGSLVLAAGGYFGAFYAKNIEVHQDSFVAHVPNVVSLFEDQ